MGINYILKVDILMFSNFWAKSADIRVMIFSNFSMKIGFDIM